MKANEKVVLTKLVPVTNFGRPEFLPVIIHGGEIERVTSEGDLLFKDGSFVPKTSFDLCLPAKEEKPVAG